MSCKADRFILVGQVRSLLGVAVHPKLCAGQPSCRTRPRVEDASVNNRQGRATIGDQCGNRAPLAMRGNSMHYTLSLALVWTSTPSGQSEQQE